MQRVKGRGAVVNTSKVTYVRMMRASKSHVRCASCSEAIFKAFAKCGDTYCSAVRSSHAMRPQQTCDQKSEHFTRRSPSHSDLMTHPHSHRYAKLAEPWLQVRRSFLLVCVSLLLETRKLDKVNLPAALCNVREMRSIIYTGERAGPFGADEWRIGAAFISQ
eukprot:6187668-Pleurochrysis_carterae.AAC.2